MRRGIAFRHELARRAIEERTPAIRRRLLNRAVVAALLAQRPREPDRLVHHAIEADDGATVAAFAPAAGREAARVGAHRQALAHFEVALRHVDRLGPAERARLLDDYAWELYNANRFDDAVASAAEAVRGHEELGDRIALGEAGALGAHRGPPRRRRPRQARGAHPPRGRRGRTGARPLRASTGTRLSSPPSVPDAQTWAAGTDTGRGIAP